MDASSELVAVASTLEPRLYHWASTDPASFLAEMLRLGGGGGWEALGASRLAISLIGFQEESELFDGVMRQGLDFLRSRGIPQGRLTGYESQWWAAHDGQAAPWLEGKPRPADNPELLTPLRTGEMRRVANMGSAGNNNAILFTHRDGVFVAVIQGPYSNEDPRISQHDWYTANTQYDLYCQVGDALAVPPPFTDHELAQFVPLAQPDLS